MFYEDYTTFGTVILVGDTYHDVAIAMKNAIVGVPSSPWAEVTGSAPTPVWLQAQASTAVAGTLSSSVNGFNVHSTLYHTTDIGHRRKTLTVAGTAGTLIIDVDGIDYSEAFASDAATTATNWVATHAATLAGLGSPVIATDNGGGIIELYKAAAEPVLTDDSSGGMSFTWSANCVMMRFVISYYGVIGLIIDTAQADPSVNAEWAMITINRPNHDPTSSSSLYSASENTPNYLFKFNTSETSSTYSNMYRFYIWVWDECVVILSRNAENLIYDGCSGGMHAWFPVLNGIPEVAREDFPHIWALNGKAQDSIGYIRLYASAAPKIPAYFDQSIPADWSPGSSVEDITLNWAPELGHIPNGSDINGNIILQRMLFHEATWPTAPAITHSIFSGAFDAGARIISTNHYQGTNDWLRKVTYGGVDYVQVKNFTVSNYTDWLCSWVLPLTDLTI